MIAGALASGPAAAQAAPPHAQIQGSGSTQAYNAVNQWIADTQPQGLQVVYTSTGSAQGRRDFAGRLNDFAVSDIGFQGTDPITGQPDTPQGRQFGYVPLVAGGTSFPYQLRVGGQLFRGLRLSGLTLAKIFTNQITSWDDPAITTDNNGLALPPIPVVPVVHSEGSGATAQFTAYLDHQYPDIWRPLNGKAGSVQYFPRKGAVVAQNGSDGVMNFVSSGGANGAIGYDEYAYALGQNFPVAKVEHASGSFKLPTQYNVAIALTKAAIHQDPTSPAPGTSRSTSSAATAPGEHRSGTRAKRGPQRKPCPTRTTLRTCSRGRLPGRYRSLRALWRSSTATTISLSPALPPAM